MKFLRKIVLFPILIVCFIFTPVTAFASDLNKDSGATGYHCTNEEVSHWYSYNNFVGYHPQTPYWSTASGYTLTTSVTVSAVITAGSSVGMQSQLNQSKASGASVSLSADSSRNSKVGVFADYQYAKYKVSKVENWSGRTVDSWYSTIRIPTDVYQRVVYQ